MMNFIKKLFKKPTKQLEVPEGKVVRHITMFQFLIEDFEDEGLYTALLTTDQYGCFWSVAYFEEDGEFVEFKVGLSVVRDFIIDGKWKVELVA